MSHNFNLPDENEPAKVWVFAGEPGSGKSSMLRSLLYLFGERNYFKGGGVCFTPSASKGEYDFLPENAVRKEFDPEWLKTYIDDLRGKIEEGKAKHDGDWKLPHNFLILDDTSGALNSEIMKQLLTCHRSYSCSIFICCQYLPARGGISTLMRNVTDYAFMWPPSLITADESMYRAYGGMFDSIVEFKGALNQAREKYSCLLYINSPDLTTIEEAYRIMKAVPKTAPETKTNVAEE